MPANPYKLSQLISMAGVGLSLLFGLAAYSVFYSKSLAFLAILTAGASVVMAKQGDYILTHIFGERSVFLENVVEVLDDVVVRNLGDKYVAMSLIKVVPDSVYIDLSDSQKTNYLNQINSFLMTLKEPTNIGAFAYPLDERVLIEFYERKIARLRRKSKKAKEEGDEAVRQAAEEDIRTIKGIIKRIREEGAMVTLYYVTVSGEGYTKKAAIDEVRSKREMMVNTIRGVIGAHWVEPLRGRHLLRVYQTLLAVPPDARYMEQIRV